MNYTIEAFVNEIADNHNTGRWINGSYVVEGKLVGVKSFGKWVQVMQVGKFKDGTVEVRTKREFRVKIEELIRQLLKMAA